MIDIEIPEPFKTKAHGLIISNEQQRNWNCTQCEKTAETTGKKWTNPTCH